MNYFLVKADPDHDYSIDDLKRDGSTIWDGVHNFAAIGFIKQMKPRDQVFIYHSGKQKAVVGLAEVADTPFENKADPRPSWAVELKYLKHFDKPLTLQEIKAQPSLKDFKLVRESRLSVMPLTNEALSFFKERQIA